MQAYCSAIRNSPLADAGVAACRYIFALTSCLLQASYLLLVERSGIDKGIGTTELLFYNALLSMPFLAVVRGLALHHVRQISHTCAAPDAAVMLAMPAKHGCTEAQAHAGICMRQVVVLTGEFPNITLALSEAVDQMGSISLGVLLLVFSVFGMLLNYSMFLCAMLNSALTTTIIGVLKVRHAPLMHPFRVMRCGMCAGHWPQLSIRLCAGRCGHCPGFLLSGRCEVQRGERARHCNQHGWGQLVRSRRFSV